MNQIGAARRRRLPLLLVPGLLVALACAAAAAADGRKEVLEEKAVPVVRADRDGNGLFDDLEARLSRLGASERVDVLVRLAVPATSARLAQLADSHGGFEVRSRFASVDGFAATVTKGQAIALSQMPSVAHVEANARVQAFNDTAQDSFGVAKARVDLPSLDGDADGSASFSKGDLVAAVVDSGIDAAHLDLDEGKVIAFRDFVGGKTSAYDDNGHGTHVAATIAGDGDARADGLHEGVAPGAALVGLKVLAADGSGTTEHVTAALDWVVQNKDAYGIEVVNLSLGTSGCSDGTDLASQAVNRAVAAGIVVLVAAGNEGPGTCTIGTPGAAAAAITVGAMADLGPLGFRQASFSSRGPTADGRVKPDVSAPGVSITSAQAGTPSGYATMSGTSMATPFAAGVALLMLDANAGLTPAQVKDRITGTALDWGRGGDNRTAGTRGADIDYGAGRLDAHAALRAAGAALGAAPAVPAHELKEGSLSGTGAAVDYKLEIGDLRFPIAATLVVAGLSAGSASSPDFDLYLFDPSGTRVAASERLERQEDVSYQPTTKGTYTLRVRSYAGSGAFFVDVSAGTAPLVVDTTAPAVSSVAPADGATGVDAATNVVATFSEAMDKASAQSAFSLVDAAGGGVGGSFSWSGETMSFDPSAGLVAGGKYTARVSTAAKDLAGNQLASQKSWSFTVAGAPPATISHPSAVTIYYGSLRSGNAGRLAADDDALYEVNSTTSGTRAADWYGRIPLVPNTAKKLTVTFRGKSSASCDQRLYAYDWTNGYWVQLDRRTAGPTEAETVVSLSGTLANYVSGSSGDGDVAVRVRCTRSDSFGFFTGADLLRLAYEK